MLLLLHRAREEVGGLGVKARTDKCGRFSVAESFMAFTEQESVSKEGPVREPGQLVRQMPAIRGLGEEKPRDNDYTVLISEA